MPCTNPPAIQNGSFVGDLKGDPYLTGERIQFQCNGGYAYPYSPFLRCRKDGTWEGGGRCVPRSCGDPGNVANAKRKGLAFVFPESVTYRCDRGYAGSHGNMQTFCGARGEWDPPVSRFSCTLIHCPKQLFIDNGSVDYPDRTVDSIAKYTCNPGFRLVGVSERVCMANGKWSDENPKCVKQETCRHPGPYPGGTVEPDKDEYDVNDVVFFRCGYGYIASKCLGQDNWTTTIPDIPCESGGSGIDIFPKPPSKPPPEPAARPSVVISGSLSSWVSKLFPISQTFTHGWGFGILVSVLVFLLGYVLMLFWVKMTQK